jgi:hypothetical protein
MKIIYLTWTVIVFVLVLLKDGLSLDNLTHLGILTFLGILLLLHNKSQAQDKIPNPKSYFIKRSLLFAAVVEGFYMISNPVLPSLLVTTNMSLEQMAINYFIDLLFTIPAYFIIFYVIWRLINKYHYKTWEYVIIMALGQALGDGGQTFLFQPILLLLIPYVMINYHAMNVTPYLRIRDSLSATNSSRWRFIMPIILLPLVYLLSGSVIHIIASILKIT